MCTLVVIKNVFPGYPLVVAANRDEQYGRPSAVPAVRSGEIQSLAPMDLLRGGTWIKVNNRKVFVALTNRKGIPSVTGMRSRGELVEEAGDCPTAMHALASVINRDPGEYNACHMVIDDGKEGFVVIGNGAGGTDVDGFEIKPGFSYAPLNGKGITIVTNLGMGPGSPRGNAIMAAWNRLSAHGAPPPTASAFTQMLTWHEGERPSAGAYGRRLGSTCLHPTTDDPDYGTVSSCVLRLSDTYGGSPMSWQYWHGVRKKVSPALCSVRWSSMMTLPISET